MGQTVFDRDEMLERLGGDAHLLREVLVIYLEESDGMLEGLRRAVAGQCAPEVERTAHSLKGALLNISAATAAALAARLETCGREERLADVPPLLARFELALDRLNVALRQGGVPR